MSFRLIMKAHAWLNKKKKFLVTTVLSMTLALSKGGTSVIPEFLN